MFTHHFYYLSLLSVHLKLYFVLFFQHLKFVQNFQTFPSSPISFPFVLTFYMLCVTFTSPTLSALSSMFVYPIDVFTSFPLNSPRYFMYF
jgi:hypothetical protein